MLCCVVVLLLVVIRCCSDDCQKQNHITVTNIDEVKLLRRYVSELNETVMKLKIDCSYAKSQCEKLMHSHGIAEYQSESMKERTKLMTKIAHREQIIHDLKHKLKDTIDNLQRLMSEREKLMEISNMLKADLTRVMTESAPGAGGTSGPGGAAATSEAAVRDTAALAHRTAQLAQALRDAKQSTARASISISSAAPLAATVAGGDDLLLPPQTTVSTSTVSKSNKRYETDGTPSVQVHTSHSGPPGSPSKHTIINIHTAGSAAAAGGAPELTIEGTRAYEANRYVTHCPALSVLLSTY